MIGTVKGKRVNKGCTFSMWEGDPKPFSDFSEIVL